MKSFKSIACLLVVTVLSVEALGQIRPTVRINTAGSNVNSANAQDGITVATTGCRWVIAWADQTGTSAASQDIYASVSNDDGLNWGPMQRVDMGDAANAADSQFPKAGVLSDGTLVCAWEELRGAGGSSNHDVYFSRSTDGGATWQPAVVLNTNTSGNALSDIDRIVIATSGNSVYLAWEEDVAALGGNEDVYFVASNDSGQTFSAPVRINNPSGTAGAFDVDDPKIVASGNTVAICFADNRAGDDDVYVAVSNNSGASFTETLSESIIAGDANEPQIAIDGAVIAVCWSDGDISSGGSTHAQVSSNGGASWLPQEVDAAPGLTALGAGGYSVFCDVAVSGNRVFVTWCDNRFALTNISSAVRHGWVSVSPSAGATWTTDLRLDPSSPARPNQFTRVAATGDVVYVAFETGALGTNRIAHVFSIDGGLTWSLPLEDVNVEADSPDQNEGEFFAVSPASRAAISVFHDAIGGGNEVHARGIRVPYLHYDGSFVQGNPFRFEIHGCAVVAPGTTFLIGISASGTSPALDLGNCTLLHLVIDALTLQLVSDPLILTIILGGVTAGGDAFSPYFGFPLLPGIALDAVAAILTPAGPVQYLTDPLHLLGQ